LRWRCPQLALDVGGRAQQAYDEASYRRHMAIWDGRDATTGEPVDRVAALARSAVRYVMVSLRTNAAALVAALLSGGSSWTVLYFDRATNVVLGDASAPDVADLVRRLAAGELWFPDAGTAAVSRGLGMSFRTDLPRDERRAALLAANAAMPKVATYHRLVDMMTRGELPVEWLFAYLRSEYDRLATVAPSAHHALDALDTLRTRHRVGELILDVARTAPRVAPSAAETAAITAEVREMDEAIAAIERRWPP
jgi:hypothetical protein